MKKYSYFGRNEICTSPLRREFRHYLFASEVVQNSTFYKDQEMFTSNSILDFVELCRISAPVNLTISYADSSDLTILFKHVGFLVKNLNITFKEDETDFSCLDYCEGAQNVVVHYYGDHFDMFNASKLEKLENLSLILGNCESFTNFSRIANSGIKNLTIAPNRSNVLQPIKTSVGDHSPLASLKNLTTLTLCESIDKSESENLLKVLSSLTSLEKLEVEKHMLSQAQFARLSNSVNAPVGPISRFYKDRRKAEVMIELNGYDVQDRPICDEDAVNSEFKTLKEQVKS